MFTAIDLTQRLLSYTLSLLPLPQSLKSTPISTIHRRLSGSTYTVPDLYARLPGWRCDLITSVPPQIQDATDNWFYTWVTDERSRKTIRPGNFSLLATAFYPDCSDEVIVTMGQYLGWLFLWDDVIDDGELTHDVEGTKIFQEEMKTYLHYVLGPNPRQGVAPAARKISEVHGTLLDKVVARVSKDCRKRILTDLLAYVDSTAASQSERLEGRLSTVDKYMARRRFGGAITVFIHFVEYCYNLSLPSWLMQHSWMVELCRACNDCVIYTNDIVSHAVEFRAGQYENIINIYIYYHNMTLQDALDHAAGKVQESHDELERAEQQLLPLVAGDEGLKREFQLFVEGCKCIATGNMHWSFLSPRYFGRQDGRKFDKDGKIVVQL